MRASPGQDAARTSYTEAFDHARACGDVAGMVAAALGLASLQRFGEPVGRAPALLHEAYTAAVEVPADRVRLAAALARSWAYGNDSARGKPFAHEAVSLADGLCDPRLVADALDAQLATSWGPDDLADRVHITARLQEVTAHLDDHRARLDAHLWRLTTALETLDVIGVHRQLAALDLLAEETGSPTVHYFAATRRAMQAILVGDLDRAATFIDAADRYGAQATIPDAYAVHHSLAAELARHAGDMAMLHTEAELYESHAVRKGMQSLLAEAAVLWLELGDTDRAQRLAIQAAGAGLHTVPRDVDFMLTISKVVDAGSGSGNVDLAREGVELLAPYVGRAVVNAGAVSCQGVVEDYLQRAALLLGDQRAEQWRAAAAAAYRRLDAPWWLHRVNVARPSSRPAATRAARTVHLRPLPGGTAWSVGTDGAERLLSDMKGLHYLRALLLRPGTEMTALDLSAMVAGHRTSIVQPTLGEHVDHQALTSYRARLRDLDDDLDEARSWHDPARIDRLTAERDALLDEVRRATGLGGRPRTTGSTTERARIAVRKAIAAALTRIEADDPATARLLRTSVHTGATCRYDADPDAPVTWLL